MASRCIMHSLVSVLSVIKLVRLLNIDSWSLGGGYIASKDEMHEHAEGNDEAWMTQWSEAEKLFADYTGKCRLLESVKVKTKDTALQGKTTDMLC